ncbi:MAG: hypothetical protein QOF30_1078, partial [Acidimicrobiaceae bacterium]|nr:hypothetical protein [Acidimicrobiaceae bacterium]
GGVTHRVVDLLEVVEVDDEQRPDRPVSRDVGDVTIEFDLEGSPVQQSRERIMVDEVRELRLEVFLGRDIQVVRDDVTHPAAVTNHGCDRNRDPDGKAIGAYETPSDTDALDLPRHHGLGQ